MERSIASQIEFWARLGRAVEPLLQGDQMLALAQSGAAIRLSECLKAVDAAEGRKRLGDYLEKQPYPHYEAGPNSLLVRIEADGKRTLGRFINREFKAVKRRGK
jgi:hypothetical protein